MRPFITYTFPIPATLLRIRARMQIHTEGISVPLQLLVTTHSDTVHFGIFILTNHTLSFETSQRMHLVNVRHSYLIYVFYAIPTAMRRLPHEIIVISSQMQTVFKAYGRRTPAKINYLINTIQSWSFTLLLCQSFSTQHLVIIKSHRSYQNSSFTPKAFC
jgi:hypothetical protein